MKIVRIINGKVFEIIPEDARPLEKYYNEDFISQCVEAPDEVEQHWVYDSNNGSFSTPQKNEESKDPIDLLLEAVIQ